MSGRYERKKPQKAGGWKKPVLIAVLIVAVSYTHLDVYKRQMLYCTEKE